MPGILNRESEPITNVAVTDNPKIDHWHKNRRAIEESELKVSPRRPPRKRLWSLFDLLLPSFGVGLKVAGLSARGESNARDIRLRPLTIAFDNLPSNFDGYRILFLADLHVDELPAHEQKIGEVLQSEQFDLALFGGDYRGALRGKIDHILPLMNDIISKINAKDGIFGVLGNHDSALMVNPLKEIGLTILCNQHLLLRKGDESIGISGTDDVHYYFSQQAQMALKTNPSPFKIALIHSPELVPEAWQTGHSLYLCGHTHGGQICLPGGIPIITHLLASRSFAREFWSYRSMRGYTTNGVGTVGLAARFFAQPEMVIVELKRSNP